MSVTEPSGTSSFAIEQSIAAAKRGSSKAIGSLLDLYRPYLLTVAAEKLREDLEQKIARSDLVQITTAKALETFGNFHGTSEAEFKAWLLTIVNGTAIDVYRHYSSQKRDIAREVSLSDADLDQGAGHSIPSLEPSPSSNIRRSEVSQSVFQALDELPEDQRNILHWRHFEDLPLSQIAVRLNCNRSQAQQLWTKAIQNLTTILERHDTNFYQ